MSPALSGAAIAAFLQRPLLGEDLLITSGPADLATSGPGDLVWARGASVELAEQLRARAPALCICDPRLAEALQQTQPPVPAIPVERPRLSFIRVLQTFYAPRPPSGPLLHPTALIDPAARLGQDVRVGPYARIGAEAVVGDGCQIGAGVHIEGAVTLGQRCVIKANSVLGGQGFGFEYDEDGEPLHFPHIGRIVIEDDVWLGACTTVERAGLGVTFIGRGAKVDDLVQVGHNCAIGAGTLVMANVVFCGGARVGARCWIAPGALIKQKVIVGDRVTVGLGAVVLRDVPDGATVAGVPARALGQ